ncbi:MAG: stage II sporulation protein P [Limnochordia bacterium]|nr:stage II sporulation protein P [Limnochordia bacterium]
MKTTIIVLILIMFVCPARSGSVVNIYNEQDELLFQTGLEVGVGDLFLAPDNRKYQIHKILGATARAKYVETVNLDEVFPKEVFERGLLCGAKSDLVRHDKIGIYHTHNVESYLPTSGVETKPVGDVLQVGNTIAQWLRDQGLQVIHAKNNHAPMDGGAYYRSRRTATEIITAKVDALFDIHRDSPPAEVYAYQLEGLALTKILLVVGAENPLMRINEEFALALKHYADKEYPGLIRGMFYGRSTFNQDLHPRALLFEVGSVNNALAEAENGAKLMGQVVTAVLYGTEAGPLQRAERSQTIRLFTVLVLAAVVILFLADKARFRWLSWHLARLAYSIRTWLGSIRRR